MNPIFLELIEPQRYKIVLEKYAKDDENRERVSNQGIPAFAGMTWGKG